MGNPLDIEFETMNGEKTTLRELGDSNTNNWVVVNVASACGFTRQYTQLQEISQQDGVIVVGFPCNQFGAQEPGTHDEICDFTASKYDVDFPLMAKLEVKGEPSETEGIGQYRITKNVEPSLVDMSYHITDHEAFTLLYKMVKTEGLFLGTSSGVNVAGAIEMAKEMGPGNNIVTILCDDATKYYSKMYNKDFLQSKKLPVPSWL